MKDKGVKGQRTRDKEKEDGKQKKKGHYRNGTLGQLIELRGRRKEDERQGTDHVRQGTEAGRQGTEP